MLQYLDCRTGCLAKSRGECDTCVSQNEVIVFKILLHHYHREEGVEDSAYQISVTLVSQEINVVLSVM